MTTLLYEASSDHPVVPSWMLPRLGGFGSVTVTGKDARRGSVVSRRAERRFLAKCGHILSREPDVGGFCVVCVLEMQAMQMANVGMIVQAFSAEELLWASVHCRVCYCGPCRAVGCAVQGICRVHARAFDGAWFCEAHALELERAREEQCNGKVRTYVRRFVCSLFLPADEVP